MNPVLQERDHRWFEQILARDPGAVVASVDVHLYERPPHAILCASTGDMHLTELHGFSDTQENSDLIETAILVAYAIQAATSRACAGVAQ